MSANWKTTPFIPALLATMHCHKSLVYDLLYSDNVSETYRFSYVAKQHSHSTVAK